MNSSISRQLVLWLAVPLTLLALAGVLVHYFNNLAPQVVDTDHRLRAAGVELSRALRDQAGPPAAPPAALAFVPSDRSIRFSVRDAGHALLAGDPTLPVAPRGDAAGGSYTTVQEGTRRLRVLSQRVGAGPAQRQLVLAAELASGEPAARYGFISTLLWDFVQLDLTLVLVWIGIRIGLRPLRRLRDEVAARSPLDLRPLSGDGVPREVAPLAATLNRLFALLRRTRDDQQRFIADTAHQLRTPLTGMLAQLELLRNDPRAEALQPQVAKLQDGVRQLSHATNQLLALARADAARAGTLVRQPVELAELAGQAVTRFHDRALQADIDLGADLAPARVTANASLLDDLLGNLVDNALKYTPRGGRVTVATGVRDGRPFLCVDDNGRGIPEPDRQRVRQRFVRLPDSPGHGSGLGLAIVDDIARLFDAAVSIETGSTGRGTRIDILFP